MKKGGDNFFKLALLITGCFVVMGAVLFFGMYYLPKAVATQPASSAKQALVSQLKTLDQCVQALSAEDKENENRLKLELKALIEEKFTLTQDRLEKRIEESIDKQRLASKKEFDTVTADMLRIIESRLSGVSTEQNSKMFNVMLEKLKEMGRTQNSRLVAFEQKLAGAQRSKMSDGDIPQSEVDSIVKQEVRKQLASFKGRKSNRLKRLKKVVALEKMRRLVRGLGDGGEYEDEIDF